MFLSRLRIRGKLTLLVIIPLLAMVALVVPTIRGLVSDAAKATEIDTVATVAGRVGPLLEDVQRERLLSVGFLLEVVDADDLALQTAAVTDRVREVQRDLGDSLPDEVRAELGRVAGLEDLRQGVRDRTARPDDVIEGFDVVLDGMIDSLALAEGADAGTDTGRQLIALDALLRIDESTNDGNMLLALMAAGDVARNAVEYREEGARLRTYVDRFTAFATPRQRELYDLVAVAFQDRVGADFDARFQQDPAAAMARLPLATLFPMLRSFSVLGGFAKKRVVDDVTAAVAEQRREQLTIAYGMGVLVLLVLLAVLALVATVARAVAVPLTRLSRAAERVAEAGETELQRIADDEAETAEPVRLEVLDLDSQDEIGDLARVFARVQRTASQLVERQVLSRRNVAEMFGHIGRRTQNLVGGQVDLIDELENEETDPDRLAKLYRLDHISNRLRRSADSLVVISGADREESHSTPVRLVDTVRLALAEIEEYTRVDVDVPLDLLVAPSLVSDMVLICGELLENATSFSPPHTRVTVSARGGPSGARLTIADHGIGMPDERLAEENARIAHRERLDLVPTQVLGLFVVGRLARRHGLTVELSHTPGGGVTVRVSLGSMLLAGDLLVGEPVPPRTPVAVEWAPPQTAAPVTVPAAYRPEPVPHGDGSRRSHVREAISRVSDVMTDPHTWNGFDVARQLPAGPPPEVAPPAPASPNGLRRRIPGSHLSVEPVDRPAIAARLTDTDADAARLLVEQLESGVARALHDTTTPHRQ
ncbi:sensor histidine kinase [Actinoplanes sp. CA-252034]|uniref:sensor histidine kinase n=1 Tax=Actinoplanes sp. CA-252034 TaxID=3239906 RepID=UPI003D9740D5